MRHMGERNPGLSPVMTNRINHRSLLCPLQGFWLENRNELALFRAFIRIRCVWLHLSGFERSRGKFTLRII